MQQPGEDRDLVRGDHGQHAVAFFSRRERVSGAEFKLAADGPRPWVLKDRVVRCQVPERYRQQTNTYLDRNVIDQAVAT